MLLEFYETTEKKKKKNADLFIHFSKMPDGRKARTIPILDVVLEHYFMCTYFSPLCALFIQFNLVAVGARSDRRSEMAVDG